MSTYQSDYIDDASTLRWEVVGQYIYLWSAAVWVNESDLRWAIQRVDKTNWKILHAEWSSGFTFNWTQRASYTYS